MLHPCDYNVYEEKHVNLKVLPRIVNYLRKGGQCQLHSPKQETTKINEIKASVFSLISNEENLVNSPKDKNRFTEKKNRFTEGSEDVI